MTQIANTNALTPEFISQLNENFAAVDAALDGVIDGTRDVAHGGTGNTSLTNNGVMIGKGTNAVAVTAPLADGELLAGNTGGPPTGQTIETVLKAKPQISCDNVAALRLYQGPATTAEVVARTTFGDGGGGPWSVNAGDTTTPDDGALTLVDALGRRWSLQSQTFRTATLTPSTAALPSTDMALISDQYVTGTTAGPTSLNRMKIWEDDISAANGGGFDYFVEGWTFERYHGGSNARGGRNGLSIYQYHTAPTNSGNDNRNYSALNGIQTVLAGDGGTDTTFSGSKGAFFGGGSVAVAEAGATNLHNVTGWEFNVALQAGSSAYAKSIIQLSTRSDDRVQGAVIDAALWAYKQGALTPAWRNGILFDYPADSGSFPFDSTSTVFKVGAGTIGTGIDLSAVTVSSYAFRSPNFNVNGVGSITAASGVFQGAGDTAMEIKTTGGVGGDWLFQAIAADGRLRLYDLSGGGEVLQISKTSGAASFSSTVNASAYLQGGQQVLGARNTGWTSMSGTSNKSTAYDTASVTLSQLAGRVMALQAALTTHGIIGP